MSDKPAARKSDITNHGTIAEPGPGSSDVLIENLPAWRTMDDTCLCPVPIAPPAPAPHGPEKCYIGSTTVLINNRMACRVDDMLQASGDPNAFFSGAALVIVGDPGFGMATDEAMQAYAEAMRRLRENWDSMTPEERLAALEEALNASLPPGMPRLSITPADLPDNTNGQLDFEEWEVEVNEDLVNGDMTDERFASLTNTVYHEGRHGEEWYNAAQYRAATDGTTAQDIHDDMQVPQHVAESAVNSPATPGSSEYAMGGATYDSVYGNRSEHRASVLAEDSPAPYDWYRALPEEQDAWQTGDRAEGWYRGTQ